MGRNREEGTHRRKGGVHINNCGAAVAGLMAWKDGSMTYLEELGLRC